MRPWTDVMYEIGHTIDVSFNGATALRPWTAIAPRRGRG